MLLLSMGALRAQKAESGQIPVGDDKAKAEWVKTHPEAYRALGGQTSGTTVAAPAARMTEQEKIAWIAAHPNQYGESVSNSQQSAGTTATPQPWGSGDKAAWIAAHPREYAAMTADTRIRVTRAEFNALPANKRSAMQNDPNYVIVDAPNTATSTTTH